MLGKQGSNSVYGEAERFGGLDGGEVVLICFVVFDADLFVCPVHADRAAGDCGHFAGPRESASQSIDGD